MFGKKSKKVIDKQLGKTPKDGLKKATKNPFSRMSMGVKQWGSYIIIILFIGALTYSSFTDINILSDNVNNMGNKEVPRMELIGKIRDGVDTIQVYAAEHAFKKMQTI